MLLLPVDLIITETKLFGMRMEVKCLHMSPWLGRLGDYSLRYDVKLFIYLFIFYQKRIKLKVAKRKTLKLKKGKLSL